MTQIEFWHMLCSSSFVTGEMHVWTETGMGRLPGSNMACPGQGLLLPNHLDASRMGGCAGLVKADGGAEPTCKIHFLSIRSLDKSMNLCVRKWTESVLKSQERKFKSPGSGGCAAFGRSSGSLPLSKCLPRAPALLVLPLPWACSPWNGDSSSALQLLKDQEN